MITDEAILQAIEYRMDQLNATFSLEDGHICSNNADLGTISKVYHLPLHCLAQLIWKSKEEAEVKA
jgi:hypothetical protein